MFKNLFAHSCIVITLYLVVGALFRNYEIPSNRKSKIIFGLLSGIIGSIMIYFNVKLADYVILDLRHLAIIIAAFFGGTLSTIITTLIIALTRFIFFPISFSTYASIITLLIINISVILISYINVSRLKKSFLMIICSTTLYSIMFAFVLAHFKLQDTYVENILLSYVPISLFGGFLTFYLSNYVVTVNHSYLELKKQAQFDYLTGLMNVRQFSSLLEKASKRTRSTNRSFALLVLDIDHFKTVNDTYGHPAGDEVLRGLSRLLIQSISIKDSVFRNGGEEFSILIPDANRESALNLAENIRKTVEQHQFYLPNGVDLSITISIGVAISTVAQSNTEIIQQADDALYKAKNSGRNRVSMV